MDELLFHDRGDLHGFLQERQSLVQQDVDKYEADDLLKVSEVDLKEYLYNQYALESPVIRESEIHQREPKDAEIRIPSSYRQTSSVQGTAITVVVPFDGDPRLFHYQPSRFTLNPPQGEVYPNEVVLTFAMHQPDKNRLRQEFQRTLNSIREYLQWVDADVKQYNKSLRTAVASAIVRRKAKLLADSELSQSLGIPIVRREDAPKTYVVPGIRKEPKIVRPTVITEEPFMLEPMLDYEEYRNILNIIRSMTQVMEQSPRAFTEMGEEDLRTHFLVQLNGQYKGQATGETFNYQGRTDILIKVQGKNIFIAECKFWRGPKGLTETIDQLLGYLSWRDTKTAILLFNRNRNFTNVLIRIPDTVQEHRCYKRSETPHSETEFRYVFHQPGDINREVFLTVLAFNVPNQ